MNSAEQIDAFCSALLGGPDGKGDDRLEGHRAYLWTVATTERDAVKRTRWLQADSPAAVASAASSLARQQPGSIAHIYVGTGLMTADAIEGRARREQRSIETMRATNAETAGLLALAVDIDVRSNVHDTKPYPPDLEAARKIYESVPLPPTMIVHTGNGLHVWWCFAEPWLVEDGSDPERERAAMYELARSWSSTLRFHADRLGQWKIDSTFDLARVLRMPGTINAKPGVEAKPVVLEHIDLEARYNPSDFEAVLVDPEVIKAYSSDLAGLTVKELPGVDLGKVWARVNSAPYRANQFEPPWLTDMIELMPGSTLEAVWEGDRTASGDPSPSGVDAALVRCLINTKRATTEHLVEAVMCRRLRSGEKVEKVDPHRRVDYLVRTVARIQAAAEAEQGPARAVAEAAQRHEQVAAERRAEARATAPVDVDQPAIERDEPAPPWDEDETSQRTDTSAQPSQKPVPDKPEELDDPIDDGAFEDAALGELDNEENTPPLRLTAVASPSKPPPARASTSPVDDPMVWPTRNPEMVEAMRLLGELLIPESHRKDGVEVWSLEYKDFGEKQTGRVVLRIPPEYVWPVEAPPTRRLNRPFYCSWYKRDAFEVPKGFRWSLSRDALIPALQIGGNRDAWVQLIDMLTPYWRRDSSGSDIVAQMHEWLLDYLVGHAAAMDEAIAVDNRRALLLDHANWGTTGTPRLLVCMPSFLDFVAQQPGGVGGRQAKTLIGYLELEHRRPRLAGSDGKTKRRSSWYEVSETEFDTEEWADILDAARDALEAQERRLRAIKGGRSS
jgi:hypothetical protein